MTLSNKSNPKPKVSLSESLNKLRRIMKYTNELVFEREAETESAILTVMAATSCLYIGDAGAAKTQHVHILADMLGLSLFDTLMSESTKPETIFGPIDVPGLANGVQRYKIEGYAPTCEILFFDEVFKANAVVLNPLLWLLNEHMFRNGDEGVIQCPTMGVFAASNEIPTDQNSRPVYARFVIRHTVKYMQSQNNLHKLLKRATGKELPAKPEKMQYEEIVALRNAVKKVEFPPDIWETALRIRRSVERSVKVIISDRRMVKAVRIIQAKALLSGRRKVRTQDLQVLSNILWDTSDQARKVSMLVSAETSSGKDTFSYIEMAESIYEKALKTGNLNSARKDLRRILEITKGFEETSGVDAHRQIYAMWRKIKDMLNSRTTMEVLVMVGNDNKQWFKLTETSAQVWTPLQIRSLGFKWRRNGDYWWKPGHYKTSRKVLTESALKMLKTTVKYTNLIGD